MSSSLSTRTTFWCHNCSRCVRLRRGNSCPLCHANFLQELTDFLDSDNDEDDHFLSFSTTPIFHTNRSSIYINRDLYIDDGYGEPIGQARLGPHLNWRRRTRGRGGHSYFRSFQTRTSFDNDEEAEVEEDDIDDDDDEEEEYWIRSRSPLHSRYRPRHSIRHRSYEALEGEWGRDPAPKVAIDGMPKLCYKARSKDKNNGDADDTDDICAVCKEVFEEGVEVMQMPCKHGYHSQCILPWLNHHCTCPLCRQPISITSTTTTTTTTTTFSSLALFQAHSSTPIVTPQSSHTTIECDTRRSRGGRRRREEEEEEAISTLEVASSSSSSSSSSCHPLRLKSFSFSFSFPFPLWPFRFSHPSTPKTSQPS